MHYWTQSRLFHSTPKAFGAEAPEPLAPVLSHERNDSVADLEEPLLENHMLLRNKPFGEQLRASLHRDGDGF
jgi:hypothetical protein